MRTTGTMLSDLTSGSRRDREQTSWVLSTKATCWFRDARTKPKLMQADDHKHHQALDETRAKNNAESNNLACEQAATPSMMNPYRKRAICSAHPANANTSCRDFCLLVAPTGAKERLEQGRDKTSPQNYSPGPIGTHVRYPANKTTNTHNTTARAQVSRVKFRSEAPRWFERAAWLTATVCVLLLVSGAAATFGQETSKVEAEQAVASEQQVVGPGAERTGANEETQQQKVPLDDAQLSSEPNLQESSSGAAAPLDQTSPTSQQMESAGPPKPADSEKRSEATSGAEAEPTAAISAAQQQQQQPSQQASPNGSEQADSQQPLVQVQSDEVVSAPAASPDVQDGEQSGAIGSQQLQQQQQSANEEENQARVADLSSEQPQQRTAATFDNDLPPIASPFPGSGESRFGTKQSAAKHVDQSQPRASAKTGNRQLKRAQGGHASVFGRKRTSQAEDNPSKATNSNRRPGSKQQQQNNNHHHYYYQTVNQNQNQAGARQGRAQTLKQADFPDYKEILVQPENVSAGEYDAQRRPAETQQANAVASEQQQQVEQTSSMAGGGSSDQSGFEFGQQQEQQSERGATLSDQVAGTTSSPGPYIRLSNIATINSSTTSGGANSSGGQPGEMKLMRIYVIDLDQKLVVGPNAYSSGEANSGEQHKPANGTGAHASQSTSSLDSSESARMEQTKVEVGGGPSSDEQLVQQHPYSENLAHVLQTQQSSNVYTTTTSMAPHGAGGPEPVAVVEQYHKQQYSPQLLQQQQHQQRPSPAIDANTVRLNPAEFVLVDRDSLQANLSQLVAAMGQASGAQPSSGYHYRHYLTQAAGDNHRPSGSPRQAANYEPSQANGHLANNGTTPPAAAAATTTASSASTTYNTNSGNQYLGPFNKQDHGREQGQAQLDLGPGNSARATTSSANQLPAGADNGNQSLSVAYPQFTEAYGQFAAVYPAPKQHHQHHHQPQLLQQPVPQYTAPQYSGGGGNGSAPQSVPYDKQQVSAGYGQYSTSAGHQLGQYDETSANYTARVHSPALNPAEPSTGQQQQQQQQQPQLDKYQAPARGANMSANLYAADYSMYQQQQQQHPISALTQVYETHSEPGQKQHNEPIQKSPAELGPYFGQATPAKVTSEAKLLALHQSDHWKPVDFASPAVVGSVSSVGAPQQAQAQANFYAQKSAARLNGQQPADHDIVSLNSRQRNYLATNPSDRQPAHQNGSVASDVQHASSGVSTLAGYVNMDQKQQQQQQQYHLRPSGGEFAPSQQVHAHPSSSLSSGSVGYSPKQQSNGTAAGLTLTGVTNEYGGGGRYSRANASQLALDSSQSDEAPKIPRLQSFVSTGSYRRPGGESSASPYAFPEAPGGDPSDSDAENSPGGQFGPEVSSSGPNDFTNNKYNNSSKQAKLRSHKPKGRPKKLASGSLEAAQFGTAESLEPNSYGPQQQQLADLALRGNQFLQEGAGPYPGPRPSAAYGPNAMRPNLNSLQPYAAGQFRPGGFAAKGLLSWQTISSVASGAAKRIPGALSSILSPFGMGSAMRQYPAASNYPTAQSAGHNQPHLMPNLPSNFAKQTGANSHLASVYQQQPYPFRHMTPPESYTDSTTSGQSLAPQSLAEASSEVQANGDEATGGEEAGHESDEGHGQSESADQSEDSGASNESGLPTVTVSVGPVEQEIGAYATNTSTKSEVIADLAEISADGKPLKTTRPRGAKTKPKATRGGAKTASKPLKLASGAELEAAQAAVLSSIEQELEQQDQAQKQTKRKPGKKTRQSGRANVAAANYNMAPGNGNLIPFQAGEPLGPVGGVAPQLGAMRGGGGGAPTLTGLQIGQYKIVPQTQFVQSIIEPSRQMLGQYFKQYIGQLGQLG